MLQSLYSKALVYSKLRFVKFNTKINTKSSDSNFQLAPFSPLANNVQCVATGLSLPAS